MRARRLSAVALAFVAALAVFAVSRGDERAAAGPPLPGAAEARLVADAELAATRHDFRGALRLARRARTLDPRSLAAHPVLVDALVELGRYRAAERALQRLVDLKPNLAAYARISYLRELRGDLDGAASAMARAVSAGGPTPESVASVQSLLGGLELARGRLPAARRAFDAALAAAPGHAAAAAGRARLAAVGGDIRESIDRWRRIVARKPLPEYAIALGEAELAAARREGTTSGAARRLRGATGAVGARRRGAAHVAGARRRGAALVAAARRDLALVRAQVALLGESGMNTDVELAIFEADHGDERRGLALARAAWAAAPSVRSADAVGWALTRSGRPAQGLRWARRALRLGSLDATFRYHAGIAAGPTVEGRRHLRLAIAHGLAAHPLHLQRAKAALR